MKAASAIARCGVFLAMLLASGRQACAQSEAPLQETTTIRVETSLVLAE